MSGNANDTVYFKVFKDATKDFKIRQAEDKPINGIPFFSLFKDTLTKNNFTVGVDEKIYRDQNASGEIAIPKKGIYRIQMQMDTKMTYIPTLTILEGFKILLDMGLTFKVDGVAVNDKPAFKYEIENSSNFTLPMIEYDFRIESDDKTFGIDFYPTLFYKSSKTSPIVEMFTGAFDLKNIVITIEKVQELA